MKPPAKESKHRYRKQAGFPKELAPFCDEILRRKAMFETDEQIITWLENKGLQARDLFKKLKIYPAGIEAAGDEIAAELPISHPYWMLKTLDDIVHTAETNSEKLTALRLAYTITCKKKLGDPENIDYNEERVEE